MENIKELLNRISMPSAGLNLQKWGLFFWGKSPDGSIVYGFESKNPKLASLVQSTKYLKIYLSTFFNITFNGSTTKKKMSLIILKNEGVCFLDIFIKLTETIVDILTDQELLNYFLSLKSIFSNESKKSIKELQGLYGELYSIVYMKQKHNFDLAQYYQSEDKRKFDFSIPGTKKIEIKTTTLPVRIHHFKLEQLNILRYNIVVISIMLQKDDCGTSLLDLINKTREMFSDNLKLMIHIENMIKNIDEDILETIRYSEQFMESNIRFYKADEIPRIQEKSMEGVFNIEFDSDLSNVADINVDETIEWINI